MVHKRLTFDLELSAPLADTWSFEQTKQERETNCNGVKIICIAVHQTHAQPFVIVNQNQDSVLEPITASQINNFVTFLYNEYQNGTEIITWGGTATDFRLLSFYADPSWSQFISFLTLHHTDIPFATATLIGTFVGLSSVHYSLTERKAMTAALSRDPSSHRDLASRLSPAELILQARHDAFITMQVYSHILNFTNLRWYTRRGQEQIIDFTPSLIRDSLGNVVRVRSVKDCLYQQTSVKTVVPCSRDQALVWMFH